MKTDSIRATVKSEKGAVASGHHLATNAGYEILKHGGNAVDAAAAVAFCLQVLEPNQNGIGGESPILLHSAKDRKVHAVCGVGFAPKKFTIDFCRQNNIDLIPGDGFLPATVPASVGTWAEAVKRFGSMHFSEILKPAINLAENGFPMYEPLRSFMIDYQAWFLEIYPSTAKIYLKDGRVTEPGDPVTNPDFAQTLRMIAENPESFYKGEIAEKIVAYTKKTRVVDGSGSLHSGLMELDDLGEWAASVEEPVSYEYKGFAVHKCHGWSQGAVFLQQLALLDGFDLSSMAHNSPEYIHTLIECAKLAFADREAYYGDPLFDPDRLQILLSPDYNNSRRKLINETASMVLRPGDTGDGIPAYFSFDVREDNRRALGMAASSGIAGSKGDSGTGDTTILAAADGDGNMVVATPSGGWIQSSPVIPGLGFAMGTRGQMFYLDPNRPNALAPRKRPRSTLTPTIVTKNGKPYLAFGTPGGDKQDQWTLQFFLNHVIFGMNIQDSLNSPLVHSEHIPASFFPRIGYPGRMGIEMSVPDKTANALRLRGHDIILHDIPVRMLAVMRDADGKIEACVRNTSTTGSAMAL